MPICREELMKDIKMNFLSKEKVEFTESGITLGGDVSFSSGQIGTFVEFISSDTHGVYAIILKNDNTVSVVPFSNIKFIGDFS